MSQLPPAPPLPGLRPLARGGPRRVLAPAWGLLLGMAVGFPAAGCKPEEAPSGAAPAGSMPKRAAQATATRVQVAVFDGATATDRLLRPGEVEGDREAQLAAALGGFVEQVRVRSGQTVQKGQIIARVDSRTYQAQEELARIEHDEAKRELERLSDLGSAVTRVRVDGARTRVERADAQRRLAQTQLERATIVAPFSGVIVDLTIEAGEVVAPGAPVGRLVVLDPVAVSVSVTDKDITTLRKGDKAQISTAGSPGWLEGQIERIEPVADSRTRTFLVRVTARNPEKTLLPGMIAQVELRRQFDADEGQLLPQDFLVTKLKGNGIFVVDEENKARWRPLELGQVVGDQVVVRSGIKKGDRIVNVGHRSLADGDPVLVGRQGVCCENGRVTYAMEGPAAAPDRERKTP